MLRRDVIKSLGALALPYLAGAQSPASSAQPPADRKFRISLAEWSIHRAIQSKMLTNLDFPRIARDQFNIEGLEFVNALWSSPTAGYIQRLKKSMADTGTKGVLIMCDDEGSMGHSVKEERFKAARNHFKWVDYAAELGCHSIRTNMRSDMEPKTPEEISSFIGYCAESFAYLCDYGKKAGLNIIIENHGGLSSDPEVLVRLMKMVNLPNFGLLPDFGNFYGKIDRYEGVAQMMPYAKGVSFKCLDFLPDGTHPKFDLARLLNIALSAGYHNWVGIEFEGEHMSEYEGIAAAKKLLDRMV